MMAEYTTFVQESDGTGFGGGIQGQQSGHRVIRAEEIRAGIINAQRTGSRKADGPRKARPSVAGGADQARAAWTRAVISLTEPTPSTRL
ncbi:hypothetical protein GCM10027514_30830 [Azotobacter armeniacus]